MGKGNFLSKLAEDQKSKVSGSTPRYLYHRRKPKRSFKTHVWNSVRCARRVDFFAIQVIQHPVHYEWGPGPQVNNVNPTSAARQQGRRATTLRGVCGLCSSMN
jgi:hypothetical protein